VGRLFCLWECIVCPSSQFFKHKWSVWSYKRLTSSKIHENRTPKILFPAVPSAYKCRHIRLRSILTVSTTLFPNGDWEHLFLASYWVKRARNYYIFCFKQCVIIYLCGVAKTHRKRAIWQSANGGWDETFAGILRSNSNVRWYLIKSSVPGKSLRAMYGIEFTFFFCSAYICRHWA